MTTWRFPDILGGEEREEHERVSGGTEAPIGTVAFHINGCLVCVAIALLEKVDVREEPPPGFYVGTSEDNGVDVLQRDEVGHWWIGGVKGAVPWTDILIDYPTLTPLVPAPPVVELPWSGASLFSTPISVEPGTDSPVALTVDHLEVALTVGTTRHLARALLTAADEAERRTDV